MTATTSRTDRLGHESYVRARFDEQADRFKDHVPADDVRLIALVQALGAPDPNAPVLDLGCGQGRFARRLQSLGFKVIGLDVSRAMLAKATGLPCVQGSCRRLPFPDCCFSAVVSVEVLEHLDDVGASVAEAYRVLRPGGLLAILDKNAGALNADRPWLPSLLVKWIDERRGRWMYPADAPVRERWFWPASFSRRLSRDFISVGRTFLLTPRESVWTIFRTLPRTRLLVLWTARKPENAICERT